MACRAYYVYATKGIRPRQLIKEIAIACGSSALGDTPSRASATWPGDFRGRRVLLAIDEAQNMGEGDKDWVSCLEGAVRSAPTAAALLGAAGRHAHAG